VTEDEVIGVFGAGSFTQSGGTNTIGSQTHLTFFHLGKSSGSSGSYQLSGGSLVVYSIEEFGIGGPATFIQSGGTHTVGTSARLSAMTVGLFTASSYNLSGTGILTINGYERIGYGGNSSFTQSGGTHTIGTPTTNGSDLYLSSDKFSATGSFALSGGDLVVNGRLQIGGQGVGAFTQTGGTNAVGSPLFPRGMVVGSSAAGSYVLSGTSSLSVIGDETIQHGTFTQSGGTHTVSGIEWISFFWDGSFALSGGTHTIGTPRSTASCVSEERVVARRLTVYQAMETCSSMARNLSATDLGRLVSLTRVAGFILSPAAFLWAGQARLRWAQGVSTFPADH